MTEAQKPSPASTLQASALERGRAYCAQYHPHLEAALSESYDAKIPGFSASLIEWAYG